MLFCNGLRGSMARIGGCGVKAALKRFFALMQRYVLAANGGRHMPNYGW